MTLVSAAAGWGKTTALGACAASLPQPAIWLSLDERDISPARFWLALLATIQRHLPGVDPDLPLARWRARGLLYELRAEELRFTLPETQAFFAQALGDTLAEDDARRLAERTEGWAGGLHLVALALRQQGGRSAFVRAFTGSHRFLLDYMHEEVLARLAPHIQRFLLQTAVVRTTSAPPCAALTGEPASQELLEWLGRHNLFVVPLDDARRWYRVHDLFREVLLTRLQATDPASVPTLRLRAARRYAAQGERREAVTHAFAGG